MITSTCVSVDRRRGALLLLVLISLAFFLLIGTLMLIVTTRARSSAIAFSEAATRLTAGTDATGSKLDEALLLLLRGPAPAFSPPARFTESILEDKYGSNTLSGTGLLSGTKISPADTSPTLGKSAVSSAFLTLTTGTSHAADALPGRVLTLKRSGDSRWRSFRVLAVDGSDVHLLNLPTRPEMTDLVLGSGTYEYRVNGREFTPAPASNAPETYDAYDNNNCWLAQPTLSSGTPTFQRLTYGGTNTPQPTPEVDNDNDGIADGIWIDGTNGFLAAQASPNGGTLRFRVSYLVLDLDGRINLNAAGVAGPPEVARSTDPDVPLGLGYGPADIDGSLITANALPDASGFSDFTRPGANRQGQAWNTSLYGGLPAATALSQQLDRPPLPIIGRVSGRYGVNGKPAGLGDDSWAASGTTSSPQITTQAAYPHLFAGSNAVADLQSHVKLFTTDRQPSSRALMPTVTYSRASATANDAVDDPYELRLDRFAAKPATALTGSAAIATANDDAVFTVTEMERILRSRDADARTLPQRLSLILGDRADAARFFLTSESWSSPVLSGSAATLVESALKKDLAPSYELTTDKSKVISGWKKQSSNGVTAVALSPETAAGLKFNVNRFIGTDDSRRAYLRGLYTLAVIMTGGTDTASCTTARSTRAAQWAVNVLDFRDEDSAITGFEYDTQPYDGWDVDGDLQTANDKDRSVVWGFERPDLLIAETSGWFKVESSGTTGQLLATLVRPGWDVREVTASGTAARESMAAVLGDADNLKIDKVFTVKGDKLPAWQLRFLTGANSKGVVQLIDPSGNLKAQDHRVVTSGTSRLYASTAVHRSTSAIQPVPRNGHVVVYTSSTTNSFSASTATDVQAVVVDKSSANRFFDQDCDTFVLERVADPSKAYDPDTNPYVAVDTAPVSMVNTATSALASRTRAKPSDLSPALHAFWRAGENGFVPKPQPNPAVFGHYSQALSAGKPLPFFHWPNRPLVSIAELALVPSDSASELLKNYQLSKDAPTSSLASGTAGPLLDAVHVPSPFAGTVTFSSGTAIGAGAFGLTELANHVGATVIPTLREPGRVNVNTIVSGSTTADTIVWPALLGRTSVPLASGTTIATNVFTTGSASSPAKSLTQLLSLSTTGTMPVALEDFGYKATDTSLGPRHAHPFLAYSAAIRLANTASVSSNVFAVWITLEITDDSPSAPSTKYRRMFAIVDRSLPVGYARGEDLNVMDTVILKRIVD